MDYPALAIRILVHELRVRLNRLIESCHLPCDRQEQIAHRLDRLDGPEDLLRVEGLAHRFDFDENDVAQLALGEIRDAHRGNITLEPNPFVLFCVT